MLFPTLMCVIKTNKKIIITRSWNETVAGGFVLRTCTQRESPLNSRELSLLQNVTADVVALSPHVPQNVHVKCFDSIRCYYFSLEKYDENVRSRSQNIIFNINRLNVGIYYVMLYWYFLWLRFHIKLTAMTDGTRTADRTTTAALLH